MNFKIVGVGVVCSLGLACSSMLTNGELRYFSVDDSGGLRGAWHDVSDLSRAIPRDDAKAETRADAFELSFDTAFLKYLPDIGGVNEVLVVFTFVDGPTNDDADKVVKILGPLRAQPDGSLLPMISRISYGPTTLASEYLSVNIKVVEFDREESDDTSAFIDFVGSAAESLSLADPVTAAEIRVAKEIGKTIADANNNDIVIDASFDLIPWDVELAEQHDTSCSAPLPLRNGTFGLVKTEVVSPLLQFFPATRKLSPEGFWEVVGTCFVYPFTVALDLVHLPFVTLARTFGDIPDHESMQPLSRSNSKLADEAGEIRFDSEERALTVKGGEIYRSKSWIVYSVSNGHRSLPRDAIRYLTQSEQKILGQLSRRSLSETLGASLLDEAIANLVKAKESVDKAREASGYRRLSPRYSELVPGQVALFVEIERPSDAGIDPVLKLVTQVGAGTPPVITPDPSPDQETSTVVKWKFTVPAPPGFLAGDYRVSFTHDASGPDPALVTLPLTLVDPLTAKQLVTPSSAAPWTSKSEVALIAVDTTGDFRQVRGLRMEYTAGGVTKEVFLDRGHAGVAFGLDTIRITNPAGADITAISKLVLERDHGLKEIVVL